MNVKENPKLAKQESKLDVKVNCSNWATAIQFSWDCS